MKKFFVAAVLALFAGIGMTMAQMPDVKIENHQGNVISTRSLLKAGKPTIISFWSITCKPCLMELNAINDQMIDWLDEADFQVVAVSIDDTRSSAKAKALASGSGWNDFIVLYDKNRAHAPLFTAHHWAEIGVENVASFYAVIQVHSHSAGR